MTEPQRDLSRAMASFLRKKERSPAEVRERLKREGHSSDEVEAWVRKLEKAGLVDEKRFIKMQVELHLEKGYGRSLIQSALGKAGISREALEDLRESLTEEVILDACRRALGRKNYDLENANERKKAVGYLARRGFSLREIEKVLNLPGEEIPEGPED